MSSDSVSQIHDIVTFYIVQIQANGDGNKAIKRALIVNSW